MLKNRVITIKKLSKSGIKMKKYRVSLDIVKKYVKLHKNYFKRSYKKI